MAKIVRFEDIEAWKKSRVLVKEIYHITSSAELSRDFGLKDQIRRAVVSVMSNIAEGFERGGNKEFRQFLSLAKGSAGEVKSQLYIALDVGFVNQADFTKLYNQADEIGKMINGLMEYLKNTDLKGSKFKQTVL